MTDPAHLLADARKVLDDVRPEILRQAERTDDLADTLGAAAASLGERSISVTMGDRSWQGSFRHLYAAELGVGRPLPGTEDDPSWAHLSEAEARTLIEKQAGSSFDALDQTWKELLSRAERLRRDVLAFLEPIAQDDHFTFAREGIVDLQRRALSHSAHQALASMTPKAFIVDDLDTPVRPPLHLLYVARANAVRRSAAAVRTMIEDLGDMVMKMCNRAKLRASPAKTSASTVLSGAQPGPQHITDGSPSAPSIWLVLIAALNLAAAILAFVFGAPAWASAAVCGAALAVALLRHHLIPRPKVWAIALCGLGAALTGFSAKGVEATYFESADKPHRYVVDIPEVAVVHRRMSPNPKAEELVGGPLVVGMTVVVACLAESKGYAWAQLEQDGSWVPVGVLRLAPGGTAAPRCD